MRNKTDSSAPTAVPVALSGIYPSSGRAAVPALNQYDELAAYSRYDAGALEAVRLALVAYIELHRRQWW